MPDTPTAREIQLWNEWLKTEEGRSYKAGWCDSQNQIYQNQILVGRGHRWVSRRLAKERDELLDALASAEAFAVAHEQWEADLIVSPVAWGSFGIEEYPRIVGPLWDAAMELQAVRNRVLSAARDAGRIATATQVRPPSASNTASDTTSESIKS